ncbi:MAG: hypothetical protein ILM98_09835 [Kiritimatiellae bacterium]|nr:hypothetical protein [Kiritimatiellia bacterium]
MKLTSKNAKRLKAIKKTLASGKRLEGLIVGLAAAMATAGCNGRTTTSNTADRPGNFQNEGGGVFALDGDMLSPKEIVRPMAPNALNETKGRFSATPGAPLPPPKNRPPLPPAK